MVIGAVAKYHINAIIYMKVKFYQKSGGKRPVADFLEKLPAEENARIAGCLSNVEKLGFDSPRVIFRQIQEKGEEQEEAQKNKEAKALGRALAKDLIEKGAKKILA